jgi:thiol-disulfide isomerase/thioredoxin
MPARHQLFLLIVLFVAGFGANACAGQDHDFLETFYKVQRISPPQDLTDIAVNRAVDGEQVMVSDHKGQWLLLNIWATWCPPCVEELPKLDELQASMAGPTFQIMAVSVDRKQTAERVAAFLKRGEITHLLALHDTGRNIDDYLDTSLLPVTYVVNPKGQAIAALYGPAKWDSTAAREFVKALPKNSGLFKGYGKRTPP